MASKLVMTFAGSNGNDIIMSYGYIEEETPSSAVKALVNGIVANGSIFDRVPVSAKGAKIVSTTETVFDLSA